MIKFKIIKMKFKIISRKIKNQMLIVVKSFQILKIILLRIKKKINLQLNKQ